jgi:acyl carrier protein
MDKNGIQESLFSIFEKDFNINPVGIDPDRPVFEQLPLDSMQMVAIAARIEETFGIELPLTFMEKPTLNYFIELIVDAIKRNTPSAYDHTH